MGSRQRRFCLSRALRAGVLIVAALLLLRHPYSASAHAFLIRAAPAGDAVIPGAPHEIRLWFSEPIDLPPAPFELFGPDGRRVPVSAVTVAPDDATEMVARVTVRGRGTFTVLWKVVSADTHPVWGEYRFSVGAPSAVAAPIARASILFQDAALALQALARLLAVLSLAFLVGPLALWARVLGPTVIAHAPALVVPVWRRTARFFEWGIVLLAMSLPLALAAQMMSFADSLSSAFSIDAFVAVMRDRLGGLLLLRLVLGLALFVVGTVMAYIGPGRLLGVAREGAGRSSHPLLITAGILAGILALSISLGSHAAVTPPALLSLLLDMAHLAAMALWAGGLLALAGVLAPALRSVRREQRNGMLALVLPRFSALALACVTTLTLTGLYSVVRNVAHLQDLVMTGYGRTLSLKLLASLTILLVASVNLLVLRPLFSRSGPGLPVDPWPLLRALLRIETLLAVGVLVTVGLLTALPPARRPDTAGAATLSGTRLIRPGRGTEALGIGHVVWRRNLERLPDRAGSGAVPIRRRAGQDVR